MSFYEARNIHFSYQQVSDGVTVSIPKGSIVSLLGANVEKHFDEDIVGTAFRSRRGHFRRKTLPIIRLKSAEHIAYVPQSTKIVFAFSALQIVLMGRIAFEAWFAKASSEHDKQVCYAAMERLGIAHLAERNYQTLSGGEKQLVLIARALAQGAKILVMDEPISGLITAINLGF